MIYILSGFIFCIFSFLEIIAKNKIFFKIIFFILILFMIFFAGLRDGTSVGTDSPAYYQYYLDKFPPVEIGYKYLNAIFSSIGFSYNFFLLFINSIIMINIARFIKLNSCYLILPLFIYFSDFYFYFNFSGIRQAIAMSFVAFSVYYVFEDKKLIALILILIASLFHITALIFIISFFVPKVKLELSQYFKFLIFITLGVLISSYIIESVPYLSQRFLYYTTQQEQADNIVNSYYVGVLKRLIIIVSVSLVYKNFFSDNKNLFLYNLYLIGFIIYAIAYLISPEFGVRLGAYFIILDCILISIYIHTARSLINKLVFFGIFAAIAMYKIYTYTQLSSFDYRLLGL